MNIYIDTCVLPRAQLQTGRIYRERFGSRIGFELLMMFDLPGFEQNLEENLDLFREGPLMFHESVWGVEHTAPRGSKAWEEGMYHLRMTRKFAEILHPASMVYHLNNCAVPAEGRDLALRTALENLAEMRDMFPGVELLVENTGTKADGTMLLDQGEFTDLCRGEKFPVLIDLGHAGANGWDIQRLIRDLRDQIRGFHLHNNDGMHDLHNRLTDGILDYRELIPCMDLLVPDAPRVIEYSRPAYHGEPLLQDIETLQKLSAGHASQQTAEIPEQDNRSELSAEQMNYILKSMNEAVCLTNLEGEVTYANRAAEKLFGIRAEDRQKIWEAIPFESKNDALIQLFIDGVMEKKGSMRSMVDYLNREGDLFHLYVNLTCDPSEAGVFVIVINNLTQLINAHSAFARYTSPEIANYVLTAPEGQKQGGQEREVSILMSDLRGFTAMSTHLESTDLITLLNHYFEAMSAVISRYGGTVIEFLGDGIFVVFGAPSEMQDHASRAVGCAVDMQNAMAEVNAWNREQGYPELAMGIGGRVQRREQAPRALRHRTVLLLLPAPRPDPEQRRVRAAVRLRERRHARAERRGRRQERAAGEVRRIARKQRPRLPGPRRLRVRPRVERAQQLLAERRRPRPLAVAPDRRQRVVRRDRRSPRPDPVQVPEPGPGRDRRGKGRRVRGGVLRKRGQREREEGKEEGEAFHGSPLVEGVERG